MKLPALPENELHRLNALNRYKILDTPPDDAFDNIAKLASQICETPIALITFIDETRQFVKSNIGFNVVEMSRNLSFCGHTILNDDFFEVANTLEDVRFQDNPLVTGDSKIRFYAGFPLVTDEGYGIGTLCVMDSKPRHLTLDQQKSLELLQRQVITQIKSHLRSLELNNINTELNEKSIFFDALLQSAEESIISTNRDGVITSFSRGAEKMLGYRAEDLIGEKTPEFFHDPNEVINRTRELSEALGRIIQPGFEVFVINAMNGQSDTSDWTYICSDNSRILVKLTVSPMYDNAGSLVGFLGVARDITESKQMALSLDDVSDILKRTSEMAKIGGWELDLQTMQVKWTSEVFRIHDLETSKIPPVDKLISFFDPLARPIITSALETCIANGTPWDLELPLITAKGREIWTRSQGNAKFVDGKATHLIGTFQDISEYKKSQNALVFLNRALQMVSKTNEMLIQTIDELKINEEVCRIAVEVGGYCMAWVGYAENDEYKSISAQAHYGQVSNFLENLNISWSENEKKGLGPGGKTIRSGEINIVEDIRLDATFPVKKLAAEHGYLAVVTLPLKNKDRTFGLLALYSTEAHIFATEEIKLLKGLSANLAAGIINIRAHIERTKIQAAISKMASAISHSIDDTFFKQLLGNLIDSLGAQAGYLSKLTSEQPVMGRTLVVQVDGKLMDNFEYCIPDSVCEDLFHGNELNIKLEHAARDYPNLSMMHFFDYQAFAAIRLDNSKGRQIGLLFVFFKNPLQKHFGDQVSSILRIFAARAASELERMESLVALNEKVHFIKTITDAIPAMIAYWDSDLRCRFVNSSYIEWFGKNPDALLGTSLRALLGEELFTLNESYIRGALLGEKQNFERILTKADGSIRHTLASYIPDINVNGEVAGFFVLVTDVTAIKNAEANLKLASSFFQNTSEAILITDAAGIILSVNPAFTINTGYSSEEAVGQNTRILKSTHHDHAFYTHLWQSILNVGFWQGEIWNLNKNGENYSSIMTINKVVLNEGNTINYVGTLLDNTENKLREQKRIADEITHRDLLVSEVHHRIKNNLQGVAGLLKNFIGKHPEFTPLLNEAVSQVHTISIIHGLQGKSATSEVEIRELTLEIAANIEALFKIPILINTSKLCGTCRIAEMEAVPIALVLNELVSNAVKHGDAIKGVNISLIYDELTESLQLIICNYGQLPEDFELIRKKIVGKGLHLTSLLLPKKRARLTWEQRGEIVRVTLELKSPIISLEN